MNGLRFARGELALYVIALDASGYGYEGHAVEIYAVGPYVTGDSVMIGGLRFPITGQGDYLIQFVGTEAGGMVRDYQLRKLNPPDEPAALTREVDATEHLTQSRHGWRWFDQIAWGFGWA